MQKKPPYLILQCIRWGSFLLTLQIPLTSFADQKTGPVQNVRTAKTNQENGHQKMLLLLKKIIDRIPDENPYLGDNQARIFRKKLEEAPESATDVQKAYVHYELGKQEIRL